MFTVGKYNGKTLEFIALNDPDYVFWAAKNDVFSEPDRKLAKAILYKMCNIKIPKDNPGDWMVVYSFDRRDKFRGFEFEERAPHQQPFNSPGFPSHKLDFGVIRRERSYDKMGYRIFSRLFKRHFRPKDWKYWTTARCEAFFADDTNFLFPEPLNAPMDEGPFNSVSSESDVMRPSA